MGLDAAPSVSFSSIVNVALSASMRSITMSGLNFGSSSLLASGQSIDSTPSVSIPASAPCTTSAWTSATTLQCFPQTYAGFAAVTVESVIGCLGTLLSFDGKDIHFAFEPVAVPIPSSGIVRSTGFEHVQSRQRGAKRRPIADNQRAQLRPDNV